jgi:hypothetical protein
MKRYREAIEDLTTKLEIEEATTGRLKIQLSHERQFRERRDGIKGFVTISKNDPELWMGDKLTMGVGGEKRKRNEEEEGEATERNQRARGEATARTRRSGEEATGVSNEDLAAQKKRENDAFMASRKGQFNEDDDEEEMEEGLRIKMEEKRAEKKIKEELEAENGGRVISNMSKEVVDVDMLDSLAGESWITVS